MSPVKKTKNLNIRLSDEDMQLLNDLCAMYGLDKTTMVVNSLRSTYKTRPEFVISPTAFTATEQPDNPT